MLVPVDQLERFTHASPIGASRESVLAAESLQARGNVGAPEILWIGRQVFRVD